MAEQLHLAAFLLASHMTHSHASWRHPRNDPGFLTREYYENLARIAERGKFDFVFFADGLLIPDRYGAGVRDTVQRGVQGAASLDPAFIVPLVAAATERLGIGLTRSTSYYQPFDIARGFATLDHLSRGRIAWNVVTSGCDAEARNFGFAAHLDHDIRYERAEEFLEATFKLWGSWEEGALVQDKQSGLFADPDKVHYVDHDGKWFKVRGPLTVPRSPEGRPAIMQAGSSNRGRDFAARWAEIIFEIDPTPEGRKAYYADVKSRLAKFGRKPNDVKIFPAFIPFVGETEAIAREKQQYNNELADPIAGIVTLSSHLDHDFSQYDPDAPLADIDSNGAQGMLALAKRLTDANNLTLRDIGKLFAQGVLLPHFVGTPAQIADEIEASFKNEEADGFIISASHTPGGYEEFVDLVVPELQRRKLFRAEYESSTLRGHLGFDKGSLVPPPRLAATET